MMDKHSGILTNETRLFREDNDGIEIGLEVVVAAPDKIPARTSTISRTNLNETTIDEPCDPSPPQRCMSHKMIYIAVCVLFVIAVLLIVVGAAILILVGVYGVRILH